MRLLVSDAHSGLKAAVRKVLKAEWQRCKVHFYRNVLVHVSKRSQAEVSEAMKAVFVQRDKKSATTKADEVVRQFQSRFAKAMEIFEAGIDDEYSGSFLVNEWEQVVLANDCRSRADYFAVGRAGRGIPLNRRRRAVVWKAIDELERRLDQDGRRTHCLLYTSPSPRD